MSIFKRLLQKFRPLEIDDEFFGRLVYMKGPKGRTSYWEASRPFAPTLKEVGIFIDAPAPEAAPSQVQREFFQQVEHEFAAVVASAEPMLRARFEKWARRPLTVSFAEEFTITSFSIPNIALANATWEASFESGSDQNHLFGVSFQGLNAFEVAIDG